MTREEDAIAYFNGQKKRLEDFRTIYPSPNTVGYQATTKEISFYDMAISALSENKGEWIEKEVFDGDTAYECSECGELFCLIDGTPADNLYNFCPNCGADMRGDK